MQDYTDIIVNREQLREVLPEPSGPVTRKCLDRLDRHCSAFIARSPFMMLATADSTGNTDISPRGDPPGFVKILDAHTLAIPDRPGNHRADSMENILQNSHVGLIFLIPGKTETLRISGGAMIVRDEYLLSSLAVQGRSPKLAIIVSVMEAFFHCSKCMIRSKLWKAEHWPNLQGLPTLAETMVDAGKLELTYEEMQRIVTDDEGKRLY